MFSPGWVFFSRNFAGKSGVSHYKYVLCPGGCIKIDNVDKLPFGIYNHTKALICDNKQNQPNRTSIAAFFALSSAFLASFSRSSASSCKLLIVCSSLRLACVRVLTWFVAWVMLSTASCFSCSAILRRRSACRRTNKWLY